MKTTSTKASKHKAPNRKNPVAQLSLPPGTHTKLDSLTAAMELSRSVVVTMAVNDFYAKQLRSGVVIP